MEERDEKLEIICNCTMRGAPIYGQKAIKVEEEPTVKFTCACRLTLQPQAPPVYVYPWTNTTSTVPYPYCNPIITMTSSWPTITSSPNVAFTYTASN